MNHEVKISIIVPVYNVEKYLNNCIKSIINQNYTNIELILIDDCSPDNSGKICDEWATRDSRIRVVHKQINEGVSEARNTGISCATGEYIAFVDSDDYITERFSNCIKYLKDYDIVCFPYYEEYKDKIMIKTPNSKWDQNSFHNIYDGKISSGLYNAVWCKIFKTSFIKEKCLQLDKNLKIAEDFKFCLEAFMECENITYLNTPYYVYNKQNQSVMTNITFNKIQNTLSVCEYALKLLEKNKYNKLNKFCKRLISENMLSVFNKANSYSEEENRILTERLIKLKKYFIYGSTFSKKIIILLIKIFGIKFSIKARSIINK